MQKTRGLHWFGAYVRRMFELVVFFFPIDLNSDCAILREWEEDDII